MGSQARCACGQSARFVAFQPRPLVTLNGSRRLRRAYYYSAACQKGFAPLDHLLPIGRGESRVGVRALTARFASYLPFEKAAAELALVRGIRLAARTVEREAEAVGEAIAATWQAREQQLWAGKAEPPTVRPTCLQISMDGVMVHVGREWKEAKVGGVYAPRTGGGVEQAEDVATLADSGAFGRRLATLAYGAGVDDCRKVAVARSRYPKEEAAQEWVSEQKERLLENEVAEVIAAIEGWEPATGEQAEVKRQVGNDLRTHAHRMAYKSDREQGYQNWQWGRGSELQEPGAGPAERDGDAVGSAGSGGDAAGPGGLVQHRRHRLRGGSQTRYPGLRIMTRTQQPHPCRTAAISGRIQQGDLLLSPGGTGSVGGELRA